jgi:hypothetical protein
MLDGTRQRRRVVAHRTVKLKATLLNWARQVSPAKASSDALITINDYRTSHPRAGKMDSLPAVLLGHSPTRVGRSNVVFCQRSWSGGIRNSPKIRHSDEREQLPPVQQRTRCSWSLLWRGLLQNRVDGSTAKWLTSIQRQWRRPERKPDSHSPQYCESTASSRSHRRSSGAACQRIGIGQ